VILLLARLRFVGGKPAAKRGHRYYNHITGLTCAVLWLVPPLRCAVAKMESRIGRGWLALGGTM